MEEKSGYIEVCYKGQVVWTSKLFLWIKENQISQLKDCSALLCMGRCKSLGSLESFLSYASQLSGASILCVSHPDFLWAHRREWLYLMAARSQVLVFLCTIRAQEFTRGRPELLMTVTSLDFPHGSIFVYCYGRKYSISQLQKKEWCLR